MATSLQMQTRIVHFWGRSGVEHIAVRSSDLLPCEDLQSQFAIFSQALLSILRPGLDERKWLRLTTSCTSVPYRSID